MITYSNIKTISLFEQIESLKNKSNSNKEIHKIRNKIFNSLKFVVYKVVKPYKKFENYHDLLQEGFIGLFKAVEVFDFTKFPNFCVFAEQWVFNKVKYKAGRFDIVYSPRKTRTIYIDQEREFESILGSYEIYNIIENNDYTKKILQELTNTECDVVKKTFGIDCEKEYTLRDIADNYNLTHERIRQIKETAINKLQKKSKIQKYTYEGN